jgi:NAD(P)-dependent dehydrogenase (short-subunit alcohol dehydrogenase family)
MKYLIDYTFGKMVANAGIHKADSIIDGNPIISVSGVLSILTATAFLVSDEDFDRTMAVNCKGVLYCYRAAAVQMIKQGRGGRIIGASSVWGLTGMSSSTNVLLQD